MNKEDLQTSLYRVLYDKSVVDIVRVLYEEDWPLEELEQVVNERVRLAEHRLIEKVRERLNFHQKQREDMGKTATLYENGPAALAQMGEESIIDELKYLTHDLDQLAGEEGKDGI